MSSPSETLVLVTGGSGFVGTHCIIALLNAGYRVRTTVRALSKSSVVKASLLNGGIAESSFDRLFFIAADLTKDDNWDQAVADCTYVLHVASPFPPHFPKNENDLIIPAREGTIRVLKAAKVAGVKRVVVTSSIAAISSGHPPQSTPFTEESWTIISHKDVSPYEKSKTLAERAAWDFIKSSEGAGLELSVVNPVGIFGPALNNDISSSLIITTRILKGDPPGCPNLSFGVVDVRDVASLHLLAMTNPAAAGERFLAVAPPHMSMQDMAITLKKRVPDLAKKTSTRKLPDFLLKILSLFDAEVAQVVPHLSKKVESTNEKAKRVLGWEPRSREDAVVAAAESLAKLGLAKK
jgi:nucleoside-diphosphate-sugar epimerase